MDLNFYFREVVIDAGAISLLDLDSFVLGGVPSDLRRSMRGSLSSDGFIGCLASVEINHDAPDLFSELLGTCKTVHRGCVDSVCHPNPCSNNGVCTINNNQVSCNCEMTSFTGPFCRDESKFFFFGKNKKCGLISYALASAQTQIQDRLSFGFTTTQSDGLLVHVENDPRDQFLSVQMRQGKILLRMNINERVEEKYYEPGEVRFDDNKYHICQLYKDRNDIKFRVDNFDQLEFSLAGKGGDGIFRDQKYVFAGARQGLSHEDLTDCYQGIMSGLVLNGQYVFNYGERHLDVYVHDDRYVPEERNYTHIILVQPDGFCPLGYVRSAQQCQFTKCPFYSDFLGEYRCRCIYGYYHFSNGLNECRQMNESKKEELKKDTSVKYIPATGMVGETPIGLILGKSKTFLKLH